MSTCSFSESSPRKASSCRPLARILPFIRDLNPRLDDLPEIIDLARKSKGDRQRLVKAIFVAWKRAGKRKNFSMHSVDANTVASLSSDNLGILDEAGQLTNLGKALDKARANIPQFKEILARHMLQTRGGWQFARALTTLGRGGKPTRQEISDYLAQKYAIEEWRDLNNISSLHSFLEWGGVVSNYKLDEVEFRRLFGVAVDDVQLLESFGYETRLCLEALVRLGGKAMAGQIRSAAEAYSGRQLDVHTMPERMGPLLDAGLVQHSGKRGDMTGTYAVVDARRTEVLSSVAADLSLAGVVPDEVFEHDLTWAITHLGDKGLSRDEKARALEVLAAIICWRLGLRHIQIRFTTEFECDVTADKLELGYQSWDCQCKAFGNTEVTSEHVLRELGIAQLDHHAVLMFVTTSTFSVGALKTIERIHTQTAVQVITLSGKDLARLAKDQDQLTAMIRAQAERARRLRLGAEPVEVLAELDAMRDFIWSQKPTVDEIWARLNRRDLLIREDLVRPLLAAWFDSQRASNGYDDSYVGRLMPEQLSFLPAAEAAPARPKTKAAAESAIEGRAEETTERKFQSLTIYPSGRTRLTGPPKEPRVKS